ncbi:MAG: DUF3500 domain-containing protein [Rhizonema sp. PD37]|nr:DUF3500 domain-containing protein [Rhizonema sp. PD37]
MTIFALRRIRLAGVMVMICSLLIVTTAKKAGTESSRRIVTAANTFLATLNEKQRQTVLFAFDDKQQRARWSNFPTAVVPRRGISLKEMSLAQRSAAMALVSSALSPKGFEKVQQIMEGDEVNKINEANHPPFGNHGTPPLGNRVHQAPRGDLPAGALFGKDLYYISILGMPSAKNPWMLQFGGHHLALNITIVGERGVLTPTLTGAQPALYKLGGKTVRPLGQESDKALALLNALDDSQRKQAILSSRLADLVLGPGQDGKVIQPEGLKASAMTKRQKSMLLDLIGEWAGIIHEDVAAARMAEVKADINETWFLWSGPTTAAQGQNITAYYRIQGPHLVIEYAPQGERDDPATHVHTMYRDPTNDYGRELTKK